MAKTPQTPPKTENTQPDPAPEPIDDAIDPAIEADPLAAAPADPEAVAEPSQAPRSRNEEKRDEIFRAWQEGRDQESAQEPKGVILEADADPGIERQEEIEEEPEEAAVTVEAEPEPEEDPYVELKVFGKGVPMKKSEIRALLVEDGYDADEMNDAQMKKLAQMNLAAKHTLEDAKRISDEAKRSLDEVKSLKGLPAADQLEDPKPADQPGTRATPDGSAPAPTTDQSEEEYQRIADLIQVGESDEGAQAVKSIIAMAKADNPTLSEDKLAELVERTFVQHQQKQIIDEAISSFRSENPDLFEDELLVGAGTQAITKEMLADLRSIGANEEALAKIANDPDAVSDVYRQAMMKGHKVRSLKEVFDAGANRLRTSFNLPRTEAEPADPAPKTTRTTAKPAEQVRTDRKAAAPQQPRTAGAREQPKPSGQRPQTAAEQVAEMRAARGFRPVA